VGAEPGVSQRLFDETCKRYDDQIAQLRAAVAALNAQREKDIESAATSKSTSKGMRIAAVGAGAAVAAAWIGLIELWHSTGR
jgi:hypothetical protein